MVGRDTAGRPRRLARLAMMWGALLLCAAPWSGLAPAMAQTQTQPAPPTGTPASEAPAAAPAQPSSPAAAPDQTAPSPAPAQAPAASDQPEATPDQPAAAPDEAANPAPTGWQSLIYDDSSVWIFVLVTLIMGGSGGYSIGKAIARSWGASWQLVASALVLGVGVRFIHFALFDASFLTPHYYGVDTVLVLIAILVGFRLTRARQMTSRYRWLYQRTGLFGWRDKPPISGQMPST